MDLTFKDLKYSVMVQDPQASLCNRKDLIQKKIINGVTGICKHGQMTAILGASGAGKTSLLNILAKRIPQKNNIILQGEVLINSKKFKTAQFGNFANYVMQNDILSQILTVRQCLRFAANLKLDSQSEQKDQMIQKLLKQLKLQKCADTVIGGTLIKGISGGQKKRTSIAFQLISDPDVLLLDQPTSGLDSYTALVIISYLNKLAVTRDKTIIMTIHQPSNDIFEQFKRVILMVQGKLIYQGPYSKIVQYFGSYGFHCPDQSNPADYLMSIMHQQKQQNKSYYNLYFQNYQTKLAKNVQSDISQACTDQSKVRQITIGTCYTIGILLLREIKNVYRNPLLLKSKVIQTLVIALISGLVFFDLSDQIEPQAMYNKAGAFFFITMTTIMSAVSGVIVTFPKDKQVFSKQQGSKLYSTLSYFLSKTLIDLPITIILPVIFSLIIYWMMGLNTLSAARVILFMVIYIIASFTGSSLGFMISSIFSDPKVAGGILPIIILPLVVFSGFFKNKDSYPVWLGWLEYLSPIRYALHSGIYNQFEGVQQVNGITAQSLFSLDLNLGANIGLLVAIGVVTRSLALLFLYLTRGNLQ